VRSVERPPLPPSQLNPQLPGILETSILKLLAKNRDVRFPTAQALISALCPQDVAIAKCCHICGRDFSLLPDLSATSRFCFHSGTIRHPHIAGELRELTPGTPEARLFSSLPEGRTMLRDLTKAGVKQTDANGRRADYHGLPHTFATRLDVSGCSHATRRALMRHGAGDQTDGYTLARLSEMDEAIRRLPAPDDSQVAVHMKTGADEVDMEWTRPGLALAATGIGAAHGSCLPACHNVLQNQEFAYDRHTLAASGLIGAGNRDNVLEAGPRSSVGYADSPDSRGKSQIPAVGGHNGDKSVRKAVSTTHPDPDLNELVALWSDLPADVRRTIIGVAKLSVTGKKTQRGRRAR
jgi:hypothetical protein